MAAACDAAAAAAAAGAVAASAQATTNDSQSVEPLRATHSAHLVAPAAPTGPERWAALAVGKMPMAQWARANLAAQLRARLEAECSRAKMAAPAASAEA